MVTPNDIQEKEFTRAVRGYKEDEVDAFLNLITLDLEKLLLENRMLKDTLVSKNEDIDRYRGSEDSIFETLEAAKALMSDISVSAEKRAEIVLKNAELEAERIQKDARESVTRLNEEAAALTSRWTQFKTRYMNLLENEIERFEGLSADFIIDSDMEEFHVLPDKHVSYQESKSADLPDKPIHTIKTKKRKNGE